MAGDTKHHQSQKRESRLSFMGRVAKGVAHQSVQGLKQEHAKGKPERKRVWKQLKRYQYKSAKSSKSSRQMTGTPLDWGADLFE